MDREKIARNIEAMSHGVLDEHQERFDSIIRDLISGLNLGETIHDAVMQLPIWELRRVWNNLLILSYKEEVEQLICWKCQDRQYVQEAVCGLCEERLNHSNCDDTYYLDIPCPVCQQDIKTSNRNLTGGTK